MRYCKNLLPLTLAFTLAMPGVIVPTPANAQSAVGADPDRQDPMDRQTRALAIVADILIARPLGLAATVAGTALFLVALPFEAMSGDLKEPAGMLIEDPARYTFLRPLGEVESLR